MEATKNCNPKADETNYFVGTELISDAWNACQSAYKCRDFYENEYKKNILIIAFSGSQNSRDYVTDNDFDECNINTNNEEFKCMGDGDFEDQKPAVVRKAFLDRFLYMLRSSNLKTKNVQAWLGLKAIEDNKNKLTTNMEQQSIKLDEMQDSIAELEWYKTICEEDNLPGYYDCFKTHKRENKLAESNANESMPKLAESNATESMPKFAELNAKLKLAQLNANKSRLKLAAFWDRITELVEKEELPKDLQTQNKWIDAGTEYRLLVEPLDIAHYYRLGKHEDSGSYLVNGRPRRYKLLQKWLDGKKRKGRTEPRARTQPPFLTQDSCFWAYVEDANYSLRVPDSNTAEELRAFQKRLEKMMDGHEISLDVFSSNSTFMKWWNSFKVNLSEQDQRNISNKLSSYASALN